MIRAGRKKKGSDPFSTEKGSDPFFLLVVLCLVGCETVPSEISVTRAAIKNLKSAITLEQALASGSDLWGEEAMRLPSGPNYDYFASLLPPLRYVNTDFRHYPIVLSAPGAMVKARLTSNGSALNAKAGIWSWKDVGVPVTFRVGEEKEVFGSDPARLDGPQYAEGWLPIVQTRYHVGDRVYAQEAFAAVEPELADRGAVFVRFTLEKGETGTVEAGRLVMPVRRGEPAAVVVFAESASSKDVGAAPPSAEATGGRREAPLPSMNESTVAKYDEHRRSCAGTWKKILEKSAAIHLPEPIVNNARRALIGGTFTLLKNDELCYSAGNSYERQYMAECGDAVLALLDQGYAADAKRMLGPLFGYKQKGLEFHDAAYLLQMLARYYWVTRDAALIRETRERWRPRAELILSSREAATGLLPRENYCGDIHTQVYSLNSNAACWRGLRDLAAVLDDLGETDEARRLAEAARDFRGKIRDAVGKSVSRDVKPPFIPIALFGEEKPYDVLTATKVGSYWCLMSPYVLGSGVFGPGAEEETAILDTLHERGGVCLGMIRFDQHSGLFANEKGVDDCYTLRYMETLLRRDDVDRALVSFYGKLAQGLTRDTFIGAEGTGLVPLDPAGRPMYLPPNVSGNAFWLVTLRNLLVQDWDLDDDGEPETLRLLFATPRSWLEDGKTIRVERAPTAFGEVSVVTESRLARGKVSVTVTAPPRAPKRMLLRARVPEGTRVESANVAGDSVPVDGKGTVDVTGRTGRFHVTFKIGSR